VGAADREDRVNEFNGLDAVESGAMKAEWIREGGRVTVIPPEAFREFLIAIEKSGLTQTIRFSPYDN
jgi:hypothetical protein